MAPGDITPMEVLLENCWFCAIEEPYSFDQRHRIGVDHILLESDYPHSDTTWPNTQEAVHEQVKKLPGTEVAQVTHTNPGSSLWPPSSQRPRVGRIRSPMTSATWSDP